MTESGGVPGSVDSVLELLQGQSYIADRALATAIHLSLTLGRPLLLEGEAGVGKTEVGKVLAKGLGRRLIRLQCYEGLDVASAVYEWDYARQMIEIRLAEASGQTDRTQIERNLFSENFLIRRPLLEAIQPSDGIAPVLLIDELDRADEPFEAFLLELLSDFQITVPELGTLKAEEPPVVVITSNRTREIHDALRRRCFYYWLDYPDAARELEIVRVRVPEAAAGLLRQVVAFVQQLRNVELFKLPGVAESIDWTRALMALGKDELDGATIDETLGVLLKYEDMSLTVLAQCSVGWSSFLFTLRKNMKLLPLLLSLLLFISGISHAADATLQKPYEEMAFLKHFTGKTPEFIKAELGEPDFISKRENSSGKIEFWIYHDLVQQAHSDKIYRYTQFGIVNGHVETLGHTNRDPK